MPNKTVLFYGAGKNAEENISRWISEGLLPVAFVDNNTSKQGKLFFGYEVLSINDAIEQYPDYEFYITLSSEKISNCTEELISQGIPVERIRCAETPSAKYKLGCKFLYYNLSVMNWMITTCPDSHFGERAAFIEKLSNLDEAPLVLEKNIEHRKQVIRDLALNKHTPCAKCERLQNGWFPDEPKITKISFGGVYAGEEFCNFRCFYCNNGKNTNEVARTTRTLFSVLKRIVDYFADNQLYITFVSGEFFVRPDCDDILKYCVEKGIIVNFTTNGSIYAGEVTKLAKKGNLQQINISLDAGTQETYALVKGKDYFSTVISNIEKFHALKIRIVLKYIMLEGINDNMKDIQGFIDIAVKFNAVVAISCNQTTKYARLQTSSIHLIQWMIRRSFQHGLQVILYREFFHPEDYTVIERMLVE